MSIQYGFPAWVEEHLGQGATPAMVQRHFDGLGVELTAEKWRVFLLRPPKRPDLEIWGKICDATGERLSSFIDHEPRAEGVRVAVKRRKAAKPSGAPVESTPPPPDPWRLMRSAS